MCSRSFSRPLTDERLAATSRPRTGWLGPLLLALTVTALALAILASPRLLPSSDLAVLFALAGVIHVITSFNHRAGGGVAQQRLMLAVLLLVTVHLSIVGRVNQPARLGMLTWLVLGGLGAVTAITVSLRRGARADRGIGGYTPVDGAMAALALMVVVGYLGLYVVFWLNGLPFQIGTGLFSIVVVATGLNFLFVLLLEGSAELRRGLQLSLGPLVVVCLWAVVSRFVER